jgi:hypothetical protein
MLCDASFVGSLRLCEIIGPGEGVKIKRNLSLYPSQTIRVQQLFMETPPRVQLPGLLVRGFASVCLSMCSATALGAILGLRNLPQKGEK